MKELVGSLSEGLETKLEAVVQQNLSEGQIQRLGIARALVEDRPILLLDESTASLDKANEAVVVDYLINTEQTVILVTHRQTSVLENYEVLRLGE